jgi:hypothetical protein
MQTDLFISTVQKATWHVPPEQVAIAEGGAAAAGCYKFTNANARKPITRFCPLQARERGMGGRRHHGEE